MKQTTFDLTSDCRDGAMAMVNAIVGKTFDAVICEPSPADGSPVASRVKISLSVTKDGTAWKVTLSVAW